MQEQDWIIAIIGSLVGVLVLGAIGWFYYRKRNPKKKKRKGKENGSQRAVHPAKNFARSNGFRFIAPANLAKNGIFANLDAIVIGYFGILGVKALGYNGEIYGSLSEKDWLQVNDDETRTYFDNPITEASSDVRVIREALFAKKLKQIPVEVVCVFTDPKAQLALPRGTGHLTNKEFKKVLQKEKYLDDTGLDLDKVEAAIREVIVPQ